MDINTEYSSLGMYGVFQSLGDLYVKGRIGLANSTVNYTAKDYEEEDQSNIGLAYGVGAGFKKDRLRVEIEYLVYPEVEAPFNDLLADELGLGFEAIEYEPTALTIGVNYDF